MPGPITRNNSTLQLISVSLVLALWANLICGPIITLSHASPPATVLGRSDSSASLVHPAGAATSVTSRAGEKKDRVERDRLRESYGKLPLNFEANQGQTDPRVKFFSRGSGYGLFLTSREAVLVLGKGSAGRDESRSGEKPASSHEQVTPDAVLRMRLAGANPRPRVTGLDKLPGKSNYFIGNDKKEWRTNVSQYAKVRYEGVYPGVDVVYYGNQRQLEYDFVVAPGANSRAIRLNFEGASRLRIDENGDLLLTAGNGEVRQHKPVMYQEADGRRQEVTGRYVLAARRQVRFELGAYDVGKPLVIDPVLSYSTYLGGGGGYESGNDITVDAAGNAYVVGETWSPYFPTRNSLQPFNAGGNTTSPYDAFVTKLNPTGTALVYSTFLGGSDHDSGSDIVLDASGNVYLTGWTDSNDFPTAGNPFQSNGGGHNIDAFVTKLNATGSALLYSTYLGGRGDDYGDGIAVDSVGNIYLTGDTTSPNFPTASPFQSSFGGAIDSFVTKFNAAGSALLFSTFLGGSGNERPSYYGGGIAVDNSNNVYVTGWTDSANFPTALPLQATLGGGTCTYGPCSDAYVAKFIPEGTGLVYSSYLGGNSDETANDIAVDSSGNAYVTGTTNSSNFPTTPGSLKPAKVDTFDNSFVTKIDPQGSAFVYSTYLNRGGYGIALNSIGSAYVVGDGASVSKLNPAGTALDYYVRFGGRFQFSPETYADNESCHGIALDSAGSAYVTGETFSPTFPITPGAVQPYFTYGVCGGSPCNDAYVTKIEDTIGYSISGRVADPGGNGLGAVLLSLSGSLSATAATDVDGNYSFQNLAPGGSYTVVPTKSGVTFDPTSRSFTNISADVIADFTGTAPAVRVSGRVLDVNSGAVIGVTLTLSGSQSGTVQSDAGGNYAFNNLPAGGTYTVTPSRNADRFVPPSKTFPNAYADLAVNFTLVYDISGRVTDSSGNGVSSVTITLSGAQSATRQTDANGNYSFTELPANGSYTITPSKADPILTYAFSPASQTISLNSNQTINFSSSTSIILSGLIPSADAHVQDGTSANTNFGTASSLKIETDSKTNNGKNFDGYFKFDVSGVAGNTASAKLRIFASLSAAGSVNTSVYSVANTSWLESGTNSITWNNRPPRSNTALAGATATVNSTTYATYDIDVTAYVKSEKSAGRDVIGLALHNPSSSTIFINVNAREASANKPQLMVTLGTSPNAAPSVSLTSPAAGAAFTSPANITISANANDSDGSISKVEFYAGTTLIGTSTSAPYQITWGAVAAGTYSLTAVATDNSSASTVSAPVAVVVNSPNSLPSVSLNSPLEGTTFAAGSNVALSAISSDTDGTISKVEFFAGVTLIGTSTTPTSGNLYSVSWNNVNSGAYALTAKATDNANGTATSIAVNISVVAQTGLSPTADAYVRDGSSATTNFGTAVTLQTQSSATVGNNRESYLKFDLTTVSGINKATVRLYGSLSDTTGSNLPPGVYSVATTTWVESGSGSITWNTRPAAAATPLATSIISDNLPRWYEFDVTSFLQAEKAAGRNVVSLVVKNTAQSTPFASFNSREATNNQPQLVLWTTQPRNALLVTNSTTLGTGDNAIKTRLQNLGFTVTVKAAGSNNNTSIKTNDADGKTLVVISSTVIPANVASKFRNVAVPVVTWEFDLFDDQGMTGTVSGTDFGTATTQTQVSISNSSHPMAAGLSGTQTVAASSNFTWGKPNANAVRIATLTGDATKFAIFGYDKMAAMPGLEAPARRVGFFLTDTTAAGLTTNGGLLFDAAVKWASELATAPFINSLTPSNGALGTAVIIKGGNFGSAQGTSTVTFNGVAGTTTAWVASSVTVSVPAYTTTGPVVITVGGVPSNGVTFAVGDTDSDGDGLPDWWEVQYFGNLGQGANGDPDGDGLTNLQEYQLGRNPTKSALADDGAFVNLKLYTPLTAPSP